VVLRDDSDTPDRYGRQHAYVARAEDSASVQVELLRAGAAMTTGAAIGKDCATELTAAETLARQTNKEFGPLGCDKKCGKAGRHSGEVGAVHRY
jgi:hypothetical protein